VLALAEHVAMLEVLFTTLKGFKLYNSTLAVQCYLLVLLAANKIHVFEAHDTDAGNFMKVE
jgi:hypothetical protein